MASSATAAASRVAASASDATSPATTRRRRVGGAAARGDPFGERVRVIEVVDPLDPHAPARPDRERRLRAGFGVGFRVGRVGVGEVAKTRTDSRLGRRRSCLDAQSGKALLSVQTERRGACRGNTGHRRSRPHPDRQAQRLARRPAGAPRSCGARAARGDRARRHRPALRRRSRSAAASPRRASRARTSPATPGWAAGCRFDHRVHHRRRAVRLGAAGQPHHRRR